MTVKVGGECMDDGFEEFARYHTHSTKEPLVTIQRNGTSITLNRVAYQTLGSPIGASLGYHRQKHYIGIGPSDLIASRGTRINQQGNSETYYIAGKAFTQAYGINTEKAWRYRAVYEEGMLKVYVNGEREEATGPRLKTVNTKESLLMEDRAQEVLAREVDPSEIISADVEAVFLKVLQQGVSLDNLVQHLREKYL